jgi:hypothetical protein
MAPNNYPKELCKGLTTGRLLPPNVEASVVHYGDEAAFPVNRG